MRWHGLQKQIFCSFSQLLSAKHWNDTALKWACVTSTNNRLTSSIQISSESAMNNFCSWYSFDNYYTNYHDRHFVNVSILSA
jgi:hypothetical protein